MKITGTEQEVEEFIKIIGRGISCCECFCRSECEKDTKSKYCSDFLKTQIDIEVVRWGKSLYR